MRETVWVEMRDGVRLATDLYLPAQIPAPAVAMRTPYGRGRYADGFRALARRGYVVASQDCRGTGDSEPDHWDYYMYEREDSWDFVDWISQQQWFGEFLGALGGSYLAATQWCMAMHPSMSAIAPEVGGLGVTGTTRPSFYMFSNAYSRTVGKGRDKVAVGYDEMERSMLDETLAGGYFNEPLYSEFPGALVRRFPVLDRLPPGEGRRWLFAKYSGLEPAGRAELVKLALEAGSVTSSGVEALPRIFGHGTTHDVHAVPGEGCENARALRAPALMITGWYDWCLDDALATWDLVTRVAPPSVADDSRLLITPSAHNMTGYHEGLDQHPELGHVYRTQNIVGLLGHWYEAVRREDLEQWPKVVYYLMGANEWCAATAWPPPGTRQMTLHLGPNGTLTQDAPTSHSEPNTYVYDPIDPTPTIGGSIVSYVYTPGSVDVSEVQRRPDVLTYTTPVLEADIDVVGPLRLMLWAASSAVDTDFAARISDVFPDGRAIQLQSATLRARYRNREGDAELLEPGRVYRFDIDMAATANRFAVGHRLRLDISSADFPKFDRNANRGGEPGSPIPATQRIYRDRELPSHLVISVLQ
jgi:predicted acyl esterase